MSDFTIEDIYPLTPMQQGMLFHGQLSDDTLLYAEQSSCYIHGPLLLDAFKAAWALVVERHTPLCTLYVLDDEEALQLVTRGGELNWQQLDWQDKPKAQWSQALEALKQQDLAQGFDLEQEPPLRLTIVKLSSECHYFIWRYHHVVHDGWSIPLVFTDVQMAYHSLSQGIRPFLPPVTPYANYIQWLQQQDAEQAGQFWQQYLSGFKQTNSLGHTNNNKAKSNSRYIELALSTKRIETAAGQLGVTQNTLFQLAWALLIAQLSGDKDIVFGATTSGRPPQLAGVDKMVGLFINSLPVRVNLSQNLTVSQMLKQLMSEQLAAREHEYYPLMDIQKNSDIAPGSPLFESLLVFENYLDESSINQPGSTIDLAEFEMFGRNNFPLSLIVIPGQQIQLKISYHTNRFDDGLIDAIAHYLGDLLEQIIDNPDKPVQHISLTVDKPVILKGEDQATSQSTLVAMFADAANNNPQQTAIVDQNGVISYQSLAQMADHIAQQLQQQGVKAGDKVGLYMTRGRELITAMLAVMKTGAAYIGIPSTTSTQRVDKILAHSQAIMVLTDNGEFEHNKKVLLSQLVANKNDEISLVDDALPGSVAYIAYTSGSTGEPKGIMTTQSSVVNYLSYIQNEYQLTIDDRVLQMADINFDASVRDIWGTLCAGACLILSPDDKAKDVDHLLSHIGQHQVTRILSIVPSMLRAFNQLASNQHQLSSVQTLLVSGEALHRSVVDKTKENFGDHCLIVNQYGPTECTMTSMFCYADSRQKNDVNSAVVPIGQPIANVQILVLDEQMAEVAAGCIGELYIAGQGLATGYLAAPDLTAEVFLPHPHPDKAGERIYRTGDLARIEFDRSLTLLGRRDSMVKLRGRRIELGAIEASLAKIEGVVEAALVMHSQGEQDLLVAWVVLEDQLIASKVAELLQGELPDYMMPDIWQQIDTLPKTANGKVDKKALPHPDSSVLQGEYVKPESETEKALVAIWSELLGYPADDISTSANFFVLGGNSLLIIRLVSKIRVQFAVDLPVKVVFDANNIKDIAKQIEDYKGFLSNDENLADEEYEDFAL